MIGRRIRSDLALDALPAGSILTGDRGVVVIDADDHGGKFARLHVACADSVEPGGLDGELVLRYRAGSETCQGLLEWATRNDVYLSGGDLSALLPDPDRWLAHRAELIELVGGAPADSLSVAQRTVIEARVDTYLANRSCSG